MPVQRTFENLFHHGQRPTPVRDDESSVTSRFFNPESTAKSDSAVPSSVSVPNSLPYPETDEHREKFRTKNGKKLTAHQWAVYDFTRTIPRGKVTTYKNVASAVGGSPRSVGGALRNNPFNPYVPCHRIISSSLFVGGFFGEWGKDHKTGTRYNDKITLLSQEGVHFDDSGHLLTASKVLWKP